MVIFAEVKPENCFFLGREYCRLRHIAGGARLTGNGEDRRLGEGKPIAVREMIGKEVRTMSTNPHSSPGNVGRHFEEAIDRFEEELQNAVKFMNDRVVPQVRRESITAMRRMAETLGNLADRMERRTPQAPTKTEGRPH